MPPRRGDDLERIKRAALRSDASGRGEEDHESQRRPCPNSDRPHRRSSVLARVIARGVESRFQEQAEKRVKR
jgi:hypothetical protein